MSTMERARVLFEASGLKHWDAFWLGWCNALEHAKPAAQSGREALPEELFDGVAVLAEITERERRHTGAENVIAVLDAVVRLIRKRHAALSLEPPR